MCQERRVFVVEDTPALRTLLVLALTDEGYTVHAAVHGAHALQLLEKIAPCLILLDLRMPVMDGHAFARAYRARDDDDAHIIVMTAEPMVAGSLDAIKPAHVVRKPFDLERLLPIVEHWVEAHPPRLT
jgi:CheY-like chemotaxis protein